MKTLVFASFLLAGGAQAQATAPTAWKQDFVRTPVAEGITAYVANESPGGVVQGNITVISGKSHSLVIDSGQYPGLARRVIADLQARGAPPVRYLANTHWHGDHLLANFAFEQAYPDLIVVQHGETARLGAAQYANWHDKTLPELATLPDRMDKAVATGVNSRGEPVDEETRATFRVDAPLIRQWHADASGTRWDAPDVAFADEMKLDLGGRQVVLKNLGKANTTGDIVAWDEQTMTLVTGDIVVAPTPYSFGSWHSEWIEVLGKMRAMKPVRIVPGHGPVMVDDAYLVKLQALLAETRKQVRERVAKGETLEQVHKAVTLPQFERQFAGDDPDRIRAFRQFFLAPGIGQAFKEARGEPRSE